MPRCLLHLRTSFSQAASNTSYQETHASTRESTHSYAYPVRRERDWLKGNWMSQKARNRRASFGLVFAPIQQTSGILSVLL
jgi:hypothetical protein